MVNWSVKKVGQYVNIWSVIKVGQSMVNWSATKVGQKLRLFNTHNNNNNDNIKQNTIQYNDNADNEYRNDHDMIIWTPQLP